MQDLGSRNPIVFIEFVHAVGNDDEISALEEIFCQHLNCTTTAISFGNSISFFCLSTNSRSRITINL